MSTQAGTIGTARQGFALRDWALALVAALAVAAMIMATIALSSSRARPTAASAPVARQATERVAEPVTGTGPDLVVVADASIQARLHADRAEITGTGPDLVEAAWASGMANRAPVTGTGPDLERVSGRR